jgi:hypothetical protein
MPLAHQKGRTPTHSGDFSRQANYVIGLSTRIAVNNKIDGHLGGESDIVDATASLSVMARALGVL